MKKFTVLFILFLFCFCSFSLPEASARTVRKDRPVRLVNQKHYRRHYTHYRVGRGRTIRCNGSCHRQKKEERQPVYSYSPARSNPGYVSGMTVKRPRKPVVPGMTVHKFNDFKRPAPVTYTFSPLRTN